MFLRLIQPGLQALLLLLFGDVKEELEDGGPFIGQHLFPGTNVLVALAPDLGRHEIVDAYDQHVLVVAAVEDDDLAVAGRLFVDTPEIVVGQFFGRRFLEAGHLDALGIDAVEDVADGAVLAAGVRGLEHDEHLVLVLGVEQFLQHFQLRVEFGQRGLALLLAAVEQTFVVRIPRTEFDGLARFHTIFVHRHGAYPLVSADV